MESVAQLEVVMQSMWETRGSETEQRQWSWRGGEGFENSGEGWEGEKQQPQVTEGIQAERAGASHPPRLTKRKRGNQAQRSQGRARWQAQAGTGVKFKHSYSCSPSALVLQGICRLPQSR